VRAGLEVIAAVAALKTRAGEPLAVRIGIATGLVIVGNLNARGALREHAVVGDTPNLAARLLALAEPGSLVIAASTRRLLGDLFRLATATLGEFPPRLPDVGENGLRRSDLPGPLGDRAG